ncbi:MAG: DNA recombination protein RmuC [bacterium]|nr:DNA recombination protein RmuC [bacterium]
MDLYIIIGVILTSFIVFYFVFDKKIKEVGANNKDDQSLSLLNQNIQGMQERLDNVGHGINDRLDNAARIIANVSKELGQVQEMNRGMQDLQNFLKSPKLRGNIGEQVLQDLLSQHFPKSFYKIQYKFKDGNMVDAILNTDNGKLAIDAKFPLENFDKMVDANGEDELRYRKLFARDVKKHIKDISNKYILPEEETLNFAVMYIPSEAVYYEIIRDKENLDEFAGENNVLVVSPNSFLYFLKAILIGMQGKQIEEQAKRILVTMDAILKDSKSFGETLGVLNTHISNAKGALDRVNSDYGKLAGKIEQIKLLK